MLSLTSHRLVWLSAPGAAARRALGLALASVSELCPARKQQLFGSRTPRLRLNVFVDGDGVVCSGKFFAPPTFLCASADVPQQGPRLRRGCYRLRSGTSVRRTLARTR